MIVLKKRQDKDVLLKILGIVLLLPVLIEFENLFCRQILGIGTSNITMAIYGIVEIYFFLQLNKERKIRANDLALIAGILLLFVSNFLLFPDTREYIISNEMVVNYFFYLPVCVLALRKIVNVNGIQEKLNIYAKISIFIGLLIMLFFDYSKYLSYMEFSYALLPMICLQYWNFRESGKRDCAVFAALGIVEIFIFGARAPMFFAGLFVVVFEILRPDRKFYLKAVSLTLIGIVMALFLSYQESILRLLGMGSIFQNSRFLEKLTSGSLLESLTRNKIYDNCRYRISTMGLDVTGFFGDRVYCGSVYPHNIVYEILMSWGWIIGIALIAYLLYKILKGMINEDTRSAMVFLSITILGRYFISGSYIIEGKFWVFFALTCGLSSAAVRFETSKEVG